MKNGKNILSLGIFVYLFDLQKLHLIYLKLSDIEDFIDDEYI